jgi:hypothetical protein
MENEFSKLLFDLTTLTAVASAKAATHIRESSRHAYYSTIATRLFETANALRLLGITPAEPAKPATTKGK